MNLFGLLQKIGRALMMPVAILPVAGILLGIGAADFSFMPSLLSSIMENAGGAVFGNLPLLFAIGTVLGLTDNDGVSTLAAIVAYVVMLGTMGVMAGHMDIENHINHGYHFHRYRCIRWYSGRYPGFCNVQPLLQDQAARIPGLFRW